MSELYWITRLDALNNFGIMLIFLGGIGLVAGIIILMATSSDDDNFSSKSLKAVKIAVSTLIVGILMLVFIPTTKDAFLIYGVGGAVDYIKSNDTAKQLPDKCIKALDKWVDEGMLDENKENK